MKNINFLLIIFINSNLIYSMQKIPYVTTNNIATNTAKFIKYSPEYTASSSAITMPQVRLSKEQIQKLGQDIAQDLEYSQPNPWPKFKTPTNGIFKSTQPLLMQWNYQESPYDILGVTDTATDKQIKNTHRQMAMKYHPDRGGKPEDFRKVQEAYEYLKYLSQTGKKYSKTQQRNQNNSQNYTNNKKEYTMHPEDLFYLEFFYTLAATTTYIFLTWALIDSTINTISFSLDTESSSQDIIDTLLIFKEDLRKIKHEATEIKNLLGNMKDALNNDNYSLFINKIQNCIDMIWSLIIRIKEFLYSLKDTLVFDKNLENVAININIIEENLDNMKGELNNIL